VSRKNTKLYVLRIAKARASDGGELFHLLSPALHTLLLDHDPVVQTAALDLLTELMPKISLPQVSPAPLLLLGGVSCVATLFLVQLEELLDTSITHCVLVVFPTHRDAVTREAFYKLLQAAWLRASAVGLGERLTTRLRHALVLGLSDDSAIVRKLAFAFWDDPARWLAVSCFCESTDVSLS
jgi:hypothetical protein